MALVCNCTLPPSACRTCGNFIREYGEQNQFIQVGANDATVTGITVASDATIWISEGTMTDGELSSLIGMRPGEDQAAAIRRYVRETQDHYGSVVSRAEASEQELQRVRKLLKKALGGKR